MKLKNVPNICITDTYVTKEDLPLPYVHYPNIAHPFIGFSEIPDSPIYFCSCYKQTLKIFSKLREIEILRNKNTFYCEPSRNHFFSSYFPKDFVLQFVALNTIVDSTNIFEHIQFKDAICHLCNQKQPSIQSKYAGFSSFESKFCWYVEKEYIDNGIGLGECLREYCPPELYDMRTKTIDYSTKATVCRLNSDYANERVFNSKSSEASRILHNTLENNVRAKVSYPLIGELWKNETMLFEIIKNIYGADDVIHHYRPDFLKGMEFDIFIKSENIAVEYQGIQHYIPQKHWGGVPAFERTKQRDAKKQQLCLKNNIGLIYFSYYDEITLDVVIQKIKLTKEGYYAGV